MGRNKKMPGVDSPTAKKIKDGTWSILSLKDSKKFKLGGKLKRAKHGSIMKITVEDKIMRPKKYKSYLKTIKAIKFDDPIVSIITPFPQNQFIRLQNPDEAKVYSDSFQDFLIYCYTTVNNQHPSILYFDDVIDAEKFIQDLIVNLKISPEFYLREIRLRDTGELETDKFVILFDRDLMLHSNGDDIWVFYNPTTNDLDDKNDKTQLKVLLGLIYNYKENTSEKNKIYIVYRGEYGFDKKGFNVKKIKVDLNVNYNNDFAEISEDIVKFLNDKKKSGLVILQGEPGVGKTSYIRYLASKLKRDIIFVSPDMVDHITDPSFIPFLMDNDNCILIIEDAEPALAKRNGDGRTGAVSNILNLTDGLLSDCLNISILATFNTSGKNIDDALLRKGRLYKSYKFEKLCLEKTKNLLISLGYNKMDEIKEPMTLADIYHILNDNKSELISGKHKKIGF